MARPSRYGLWLVALFVGCAPRVAPRPHSAAQAPVVPPVPAPAPRPRAHRTDDTPPAPPPGSALWAEHFGGGGSAQGTGIAVGPDRDIVLTGQYTRDIEFGDARYQSRGLEDVFVAKLDPDGKPLWSRSFGGKGNDYASAAAVDAKGNVYITGFFTGAIDFGSGPVRSKGVHDVFLVKLSPDGEPVWSRRYGDAADQVSLRVFPDASGQLVAAGYARGTVVFGKHRVSSYPDKSTFIARLDAGGNALWSTGFGHIYDYAYPAAVTDARGHVFFSAGSDPSPEFGGPARHKPRETDLGLVLGELDDAGKVVWRKRLGGGSSNMETSIGLEPNGDIVTAGSFGGRLDFGGGEYRSKGLSDSIRRAADPHGCARLEPSLLRLARAEHRRHGRSARRQPVPRRAIHEGHTRLPGDRAPGRRQRERFRGQAGTRRPRAVGAVLLHRSPRLALCRRTRVRRRTRRDGCLHGQLRRRFGGLAERRAGGRAGGEAPALTRGDISASPGRAATRHRRVHIGNFQTIPPMGAGHGACSSDVQAAPVGGPEGGASS